MFQIARFILYQTYDFHRQVARALLRPGFWSAQLTTDPGYTWYLDLVNETVERALRETGAEQVCLLRGGAGIFLRSQDGLPSPSID